MHEHSSLNKVLISPYVVGQIDGTESILNNTQLFPGLPDVKISKILYSSLIQSGCRYFECLGDEYIPDAMKKRAIVIKDRECAADILLVEGLFKRHLPENYENDEYYKEVLHLKRFLWEILICYSRKTTLVSLSEIPRIESVQDKLPTEIFIPIKNFLQAFSTLELELPGLIISTHGDNVKAIEEIFSHPLYNEYAEYYYQLKQSNFSHNLDILRRFVEKFILRYPTLIAPSRVAISIAPSVVSHFLKILDANQVSQVASILSYNRQRNVEIVDLSPTISEVIKIRVSGIKQAY